MSAEPEGAHRDPDRTDSGTESPESAASDVETPAVEDAPIGFDQLFDILKNERRRRVLGYLIESGEEVTLDELAEAIAARETGKDVRQITSQERKRVYVGLYQCHLPKMDDYGAVSYNKPRGRIAPGEHTLLFERYLSADEEPDDSAWTRYHSTLSLTASLLLVVPVLVGAVTSSAPLLIVAALLVGGLIGVSTLRFLR